MNWYMIKTKDTYVSKLCNFFFNFKIFARCHPSVLSHHALETAECDESYYIERGGSYLVVGVLGILLPWVILRRDGHHDHIQISTFFLWRQFLGVGYALIWLMGGVYPYMGAPWVFWGAKKPHTLLLLYILINCFFKQIVDIFLTKLNIKSHIY
jgi:hypothetical protein